MPSHTFANLTVNYHSVNNLEPDTYYRFSVFARNRLGPSAKSVYLTLRTLSSPNYRLKPVYASADEQKLNGLIANSLIGEDFLELTVILCLFLLFTISVVTFSFIYCRKRTTNQEQNKDINKGYNVSESQCSSHPVDSGLSCKFASISNDLSLDNALTSTVSSSKSNQLTTTNNSLSTASSYMVKNEFISTLPSSFSQSLNNFDSTQCKCKHISIANVVLIV